MLLLIEGVEHFANIAHIYPHAKGVRDLVEGFIGSVVV
jgi:hypothetical protein